MMEMLDRLTPGDLGQGSVMTSSSFSNSDGLEHFSTTSARMGPGGAAEIQRQVMAALRAVHDRFGTEADTFHRFGTEEQAKKK